MNELTKFKDSLSETQIPAGLSVLLQALWFDGKGDWEAAHDLIDQLQDKNAAHLHAYLHRKEGDNWNADYWYNRAGEKSPQLSLEEEWEKLFYKFQ
ncbi:hypothetical protein [Pedobacter sp. MR2016-24]|uniref:hypothetical protein n=1 Tax=Pedobacter sp. MR2016-24 TaxID=2994466 RepID=UPI0022475D4D|nr:hypothetical protein [Pedobacter sp. MR2016-24]MCX2484953.1 hypothetical protein [Pedobacter sp. MR2016-24]